MNVGINIISAMGGHVLKKKLGMIIVLSLLFVIQLNIALYAEEIDSVEEAKGCQMEVVNCSEFVTLRSEASEEAEDLAHIPLGEIIWGFKIPAYRQEWYEGLYSDDYVWCLYQGKYGFVKADYMKNVTTGEAASASEDWRKSIDGAYLYGYNINDMGIWGANTPYYGYYVKESDDESSIEISRFYDGKIQTDTAFKNDDGTYSFISNDLYEGYESVYECYEGVFVAHGFEEGLSYYYKTDMTYEEMQSYLSAMTGYSYETTVNVDGYETDVLLSDRIDSMIPIIRTYANCNVLNKGEDFEDCSCLVQDNENFWNRIYIFSLFNYNWNSSFTYSKDEIVSIGYAMFSDFDGILPEYPSFFNQEGRVTIEGDTITFTPATPEVQDFDLVMYNENEDASVDAVYLQRWDESYYSGYPEDNYYLVVHMKPNLHIDSADPYYYTVDSVRLDRMLVERNQGWGADGSLKDFLGAYTLNTDMGIAGNADSNPELMELYTDQYGHLIRYRGILYGTLGTTHYNIMNYTLEGNTLRCEYNADLGYANTLFSKGYGTAVFTMEDGKLYEGSDVWYPYEYQNASAGYSESGSPSDAQSGYVIPGSDSRYLTMEDIRGLDSEQLRIARNEIYARHGRRFKDSGLQAYFDSQSWYNGTIAPDDFAESYLNDYERKNADLILKYEKQ